MLGNFINQLRENIGAMPMQSRAIAVMLIGVIVVGVGLLMKGTSQGSSQYLFDGRLFSEEDIHRAELAFGNAGLKDYEFNGSRIKVPYATRDSYLRALSDGDALPAGEEGATQKVLNGTSVFTPSSVFNQQIERGKEADLARRISQFADVKKATVFYDSQREGFSSQRKQTASVIVVPFGNDPISMYRKKEISELVSGAYAGLVASDVTVTDTNARANEEDPWVNENDPYYRTKKHYELQWKSKILRLLADFGPPKVEVYVELDPQLATMSREVKIDANPTTLEETSSTRSLEATNPRIGGVPGAASNGLGNTPTRIDESLAKTKETETKEHTRKDVGQTQTQTSKAGLVPIKTSVVIGLRSSYYEDLWKMNWLSQNPESDPSEVPALTAAERERMRTETQEEIRSVVSTIIPDVRAGDDRHPLVKILESPDLPVPQGIAPVTANASTTWLADSWQSILLACVAFAALFVVRGALKAPPEAPMSDFTEGFGLDIPAAPVDELAISDTEDGTMPIMEVTGAHLKDELNQIIENNPDAAANVIRGWLNDAA